MNDETNTLVQVSPPRFQFGGKSVAVHSFTYLLFFFNFLSTMVPPSQEKGRAYGGTLGVE